MLYEKVAAAGAVVDTPASVVAADDVGAPPVVSAELSSSEDSPVNESSYAIQLHHITCT